ncbi:hypothetical protein [Desulfitispora alkaliphila]
MKELPTNEVKKKTNGDVAIHITGKRYNEELKPWLKLYRLIL